MPAAHSLTPANSQTLRGRGSQKKGSSAQCVSRNLRDTNQRKVQTPSLDPRGCHNPASRGGRAGGSAWGNQRDRAFKGQAPYSDPGAGSEFPPSLPGSLATIWNFLGDHHHASRVGVVRASWRAGGAQTPQPLPLWQFCQEQDMATGPNARPMHDCEGAALTQPWLKVKGKEQSPGARGPWLRPFFSLGSISPPAKWGGWAGIIQHLRRAGDRDSGEVEGPELRPHPSSHSRVGRSSPNGLYEAHPGFSNFKCELSFKHPRSLPQHPGFQLFMKNN